VSLIVSSSVFPVSCLAAVAAPVGSGVVVGVPPVGKLMSPPLIA